MLPEVTATRYVTPLREGGSLPGLMEADDLGTYVVKFHGAGQGRKTLVAEVICSRLARGLGLDTPDLAVVDVDPGLAPCEPDEEVQDLLRASPGANLGVDYLPGALDVDARTVDPVLAARILWFDALIGNVDRSWRNPNMLLWHGRVHLIDHGAALDLPPLLDQPRGLRQPALRRRRRTRWPAPGRTWTRPTPSWRRCWGPTWSRRPWPTYRMCGWPTSRASPRPRPFEPRTSVS